MPARWFLGVNGEKVSFEDGPAYFEGREIMPAFAVRAILKELQDKKPSFNVRPSDAVPTMNCRRQRVWMESHDYGVDPLLEEPALEGGAFHQVFGSMEISVPERVTIETAEGTKDATPRILVCGVPMKGKIDWLEDGLLTDLKTTAPFFYAQYPPKGSIDRRPFVVLWEPPAKDDIEKWKLQLSIYAVMLGKVGAPTPTMGRVWKRYGGIKPDQFKRWHRFDFPLLTEEQLERNVGPWLRSLAGLLKAAELDQDAWKLAPPDGLKFVGKRGNKWACDRCPLRLQCNDLEGMDVW